MFGLRLFFVWWVGGWVGRRVGGWVGGWVAGWVDESCSWDSHLDITEMAVCNQVGLVSEVMWQSQNIQSTVNLAGTWETWDSQIANTRTIPA